MKYRGHARVSVTSSFPPAMAQPSNGGMPMMQRDCTLFPIHSHAPPLQTSSASGLLAQDGADHVCYVDRSIQSVPRLGHLSATVLVSFRGIPLGHHPNRRRRFWADSGRPDSDPGAHALPPKPAVGAVHIRCRISRDKKIPALPRLCLRRRKAGDISPGRLFCPKEESA